jgi:hypothetical protein
MKKRIIFAYALGLFCYLIFILAVVYSGLVSHPKTVQAGSVTPTPFLPEGWGATTEFIPPIQPTFGPPLDWPESLDQAWYWIEEGHRGYTFTPCESGNWEKPYISWAMAEEAVGAQTPDRSHPYIEIYADDLSRIVAVGGASFPPGHRLIKIHEDLIFAKLFQISLEGHFWVCGDENEKPIFHGPGIQEFLDWVVGGSFEAAQ